MSAVQRRWRRSRLGRIVQLLIGLQTHYGRPNSRAFSAAESSRVRFHQQLKGVCEVATNSGDRMDTADIEHKAQKASDGLTMCALIPASARRGACGYRVVQRRSAPFPETPDG